MDVIPDDKTFHAYNGPDDIKEKEVSLRFTEKQRVVNTGENSLI